LTEGRESIEASFVFCLWKEPDLFDDFRKVNENGDDTLFTEDGVFYFSLGKQLYKQGYRSFDNVTIYTFLEDKPTVKESFETLGGYKTIEDLRSIVNTENVEAYYDRIVKSNFIMSLHNKGFNVLQNIDKFNKMTYQEVYDYYDFLLNNISINTSHDIEIESLELDDRFVKECNEGAALGISYGKVCKILNYLTLGLPLGEMFMVAGYSGIGKSSFVFENMILSATMNGVKCAVISNEQRSKDFKMLLLIHILTQDLNYWEMTRKKLKMGNFDKEQLEMINKAKRISSEKYSALKFAKLFDNDMSKVKKIIKKLSKLGYQVILFDTMKSEDEVNEAMWQQLLIHSRKLFQLASKENIALIPTYQLALHTLNKRFLDASCLSNAKQIKEVFSEMIYFREIWSDEFNGEKFDINPYQLEKDESGKYLKVKKIITLDKDKKYLIAFLDKTRNDEDKQQILYEFNGRFNKWVEVGYCNVINEHK
jgi:replicative DNA helicase